MNKLIPNPTKKSLDQAFTQSRDALRGTTLRFILALLLVPQIRTANHDLRYANTIMGVIPLDLGQSRLESDFQFP